MSNLTTTELLPMTELAQDKSLDNSKQNAGNEINGTDPTADLFAQHPFRRKEAVPIQDLPAELPVATIPPETDCDEVVKSALKDVESSFSSALFQSAAIWRDHYALTGTFRTFTGNDKISNVWKQLASVFRPGKFTIEAGSSRISQIAENGWIQARFTFHTTEARGALCSGQILLVPDVDKSPRKWKIWVLVTMLETLDNMRSPDIMLPEAYEPIAKAKDAEHCDYDSVIIGAGFGGLVLAGRLQAVGLKYLVIEKHDQVGDSWRQRYDSARFHTVKRWSDTPFDPVFGADDSYETFLGRDALAKGYTEFARRHRINVWTVRLRSRGKDEEYSLRTTHLVFAIGTNGVIPRTPQLADREQYKGIAMHSVEYVNAKQWQGLRGVIVGTANTAHDVAEDMVEAGMASVTMIQRSKTLVSPVAWHEEFANRIYTDKRGVEFGDRENLMLPWAVVRLIAKKGACMRMAVDPLFKGLERAGFRVDWEGDLYNNLSTTLGQHYMDMGASQKIADGLIKIKGDAALTGFTSNGLKFSDGSELGADVVVFATGFDQDYPGAVTKFVGEDVGQLIDGYWRLDAEGEYRGAYKPQGVHGLWMHGGGVHYARFNSRFMAMHMKADVDGNPIQQYTR